MRYLKLYILYVSYHNMLNLLIPTPAMTQAWHTLVDTLRRLDQNGGDDKRAVLVEKQTLDTALDQLSTLLELRRATHSETPRASPAPDSLLTPPSGVKRKRRLSVSQSPAPAPHTGGSESALSSLTSPRGRQGTPLRDKRSRGDTSDQLPLRSGRRIAVKQKQTGRKEEEDEWILASVHKMVGDTRYEVQDADDGTRWTTNLRSIILLPDPAAPTTSSAHPSNLDDFPRGSQVLALYPDTTSFYRATVVSAPAAGSGNRGQRAADPAAKPGVYRLAFVDDGDHIHEVDKDLVVLVSIGWAC